MALHFRKLGMCGTDLLLDLLAHVGHLLLDPLDDDLLLLHVLVALGALARQLLVGLLELAHLLLRARRLGLCGFARAGDLVGGVLELALQAL